MKANSKAAGSRTKERTKPVGDGLHRQKKKSRHDRSLSLASLMDTISEAMIVTDLQSNILEWNAAAEKIYGWKASEVLGKQLDEILQTTPAKIDANEAIRIIGETGAWSGEVTQMHRTGVRIPIWSRVSMTRAENGEPIGWIGLNRDITERKQAEEKVTLQNQRLNVLREIDIAILAADSIEKIVSAALSHIRELIGCQRAHMSILDWETKEALIYNVSALDETFIPKGTRVPLATSPDLMQRLSQNQLILIEDLTALPDPPPLFQAVIREGSRSVCILPLFSQGSLIGTFNMSSEIPGLFDEEKISLGREVANRVAIAITQQQLRQATLESEEKYRALFQNSQDAILLTSPDGDIQEANPAACRMLGGTEAEIRAMTQGELTDLTNPQLNAMFEERARTGNTSGQLTIFRRDGSTFPAEVSSILYQDRQGNLRSSLIIRNIMERKQAEENLERQLKRLNALRKIDTAISSSFDRGPVLDVVLQEAASQLGVDACAILLLNTELQTIEYAASRGFRSNALQYTYLKLGEGYARQAVLKRKTIHIANLMKTGSRLADALQSEQEAFVHYYGTPLIVKGEAIGALEIYHRSHLAVDAEWLDFLETLAGQAAIAIDNARLFENLQRSNDSLEHRVIERTAELHRANVELEHANRAKDEFLATMSHELRTPLNSILGLSESLLEQRRGPLNESQQRMIGIVQSSGSHLLELINDILDLSKIDSGMFELYRQSIDVNALCRSSLSFVQEQATRKSIHLVYEEAQNASPILADPRRLKQMLVNLLTNAVKFTPQGGQVTLQVNALAEEGLIQLSIVDTGIGIAPDDLKRLFQPFVQVDSSLTRQFEGTGLGLALVQKLADLHGGSVGVESILGKGSRFTINLPWEMEATVSPEATLSGQNTPHRQNGNDTPAASPRPVVLLAEDNQANILTMREYLESCGFVVVVTYDGWETINKAEETKPDIILMDVQMPVIDGLEATRRLRATANFASTPIIAITALAMPGDRERCLAAGANEYMSKPVSLKALRQKIASFLEKE